MQLLYNDFGYYLGYLLHNLPSVSIGTDSIGAKIANVRRQNKFIIFRLCIMISALGLFKFKAAHHMFRRKKNYEFLLIF